MVGFRQISSQHFSSDLRAGFVLFLIALPLCVGIALASGAPASSGIIAGVIGGTLGALLGGARVNINGPAAGMIVVVVNGITLLSDGDPRIGFRRFLACVAVVGVLQVLAGLARLGKGALLAPAAVVHGMMAAIGTIILIKQVPVLLGVKPTATTLLGTVAQLPELFEGAVWPVALVGVVCLLFLVAWSALPDRFTKLLPGPLMAVAVGLAFSLVLDFAQPHHVALGMRLFDVGPQFLVPLPVDPGNFLTFPLFDELFAGRSLMVILTVFLVGSLESQLSTLAVDKLDPLRRASDFDQEFIGKGLTNLACGLLGGLPVITEIVRSSANISVGAQSPLSNVVHGVLLALAVMLIPEVLRQIPLTALASVLLLVGWRLAHPRHFRHAWRSGMDAFAAFLVTWSVTIADDLLVGLGLGFLTYVVCQLLRGIRPRAFWAPDVVCRQEPTRLLVVARGALVFSSYLVLRGACGNDVTGRELCLDLSGVTHLDGGVRDNLESLVVQLRSDGIEVVVVWPAA